MRWLLRLLVVVVVAAASMATVTRGANVTYDGRSLIIDGQRKMLFSGSIHYTRSTPEMWPSLIQQAKEGGLDVIQTYVFWNLHEPQPGQYNFCGRLDMVGFLKEVQAQGLYATLRIGPFIEAEWSYGGFPFWLHDIPDIVFRTNNEPFKFYMQNFTTKIVDMMKSEGLYASQGGPIILSQIENEYQNVESSFGEQGHVYVQWAANMAVGLETGVPWVMCKQQDAPNPLINTCNGKRCGESFLGPNSPDKPALWTENWTSFYQMYGGEPDIRSAEDIAYQTLLFIAKLNGSYINYYMYHGGTNFGRTGSAYVTTNYYDQAPLDEYGLKRQPKWGHLQELHAAIKACSTPFLYGEKTNISLGQLQEAYVFEEQMGSCVAFLLNYNRTGNVTVEFRNSTFELLPNSISILKDCMEPIFNTAKVNVTGNTRTTSIQQIFDSAESWQEFEERIPNFLDTLIRSDVLLEQMNTTKDISDYLWYTFSFQANSSCNRALLHVESCGHVAHAFANGVYLGSEHGNHSAKGFEMESPISLSDQEILNNISILSVLVGLPDAGAFLESRFAGLSGVEIRCSQGESYNFNNYSWGYQVGLNGEKLQIYEEQNLDKVAWTDIGPSMSENQTLTWYKTVFDGPDNYSQPLALNLTTMGKGEVWINGQSIGRYWVSFRTPSGNPSQALYHIPQSFLKPSGNLLILLEEVVGNPLGIALLAVSTIESSDNFSHDFHLPL